MSRPRIRTLKPETWSDEKVGALTRDARLLFVGLITMADDDGRLRDLTAAILGHVFPYDQDAATNVAGWLEQLHRAGLIARYSVAGHAYIAINGWSKHQKINRPTPSSLPAPPPHGDLTESSVNHHGGFTEASLSPHDLARAPAQADRIGSGSGTDLTPNAAVTRDATEGESQHIVHNLASSLRSPARHTHDPATST